jgi:iron complex transport system ATP-binding protein
MESPAINIEHATVFLGGTEIIHDLNWQVKRGERCFILGANGAGKTTLVHMLMGFAWPLFGAKVQIMGNTFGQVNLADLRKTIAWVSPFMHQWLADRPWTGLEMVLAGIDGTIGLYRKTTPEEESKAMNMMKALRVEHLADRNLSTMSSGEQVKILIASALMKDPQLMILDEPSVYLDISGREFLLKAISDLAVARPDLTIIFITQRIEDILPIFDRGMILKKGRIVAEGLRDEVLTEPNLKQAYELDIRLIKTDKNRYWTVID